MYTAAAVGLVRVASATIDTAGSDASGQRIKMPPLTS
jgi:hypothetical protein